MLTCKEVSKLVSDSLERDLPFRQRLGVRMHLMMCSMCRTYKKQTLFLRDLFAGYSRRLDVDQSINNKLPSATADRIRQAWADQVDDEPEKHP
jgi:hypothetical protein